MNVILYAQCVFMFMLGQGIHLFWLKLPSFKERAAAQNKPFSYKEWWECDKWLVIGLQLFGISVLLVVNQLMVVFPNWHFNLDTAPLYLWAFGAFGSNIVFAKFSQFSKGQIKLSDIQANVTSIVVGETSGTKDLIEKASAALNTDVTKLPEAPKP